MVTTEILEKIHVLATAPRLNFFRDLLFARALKFGWDLQAWAILSNHWFEQQAKPSFGKRAYRFKPLILLAWVFADNRIARRPALPYGVRVLPGG